MKTLIIVAHPDLTNSKVNKHWVDQLKKNPNRYTVHELYQEYPSGVIDIKKEQALIEQHDVLILQFPIYWFSCPPLLKQWLDDVFEEGWAYHTTDNKLKDKKIGLAVSAGIKEKNYTNTGRYMVTLDQILLPFVTTCLYVEAQYQGYTAFYGAEYESTDERIEQSTLAYHDFLVKIQNS